MKHMLCALLCLASTARLSAWGSKTQAPQPTKPETIWSTKDKIYSFGKMVSPTAVEAVSAIATFFLARRIENPIAKVGVAVAGNTAGYLANKELTKYLIEQEGITEKASGEKVPYSVNRLSNFAGYISLGGGVAVGLDIAMAMQKQSAEMQEQIAKNNDFLEFMDEHTTKLLEKKNSNIANLNDSKDALSAKITKLKARKTKAKEKITRLSATNLELLAKVEELNQTPPNELSDKVKKAVSYFKSIITGAKKAKATATDASDTN